MPGSSNGVGFSYRAFISYCHRDKAWADWLHRSLESYRVPSRLVGKQTEAGVIPRRLNPVFRDREELASAAELGRKVNEALGQSENLIVICSPAAAASRWVNEEVLAYKRMGRGGRIFCVIVEGEPNASDLPGREAEECFCPALRCQLDDLGQPGTKRAEPVAADARPGKDGKANARLKLIAGMLDVGFDALKQREQHRKLRRMAAITGLALLVMAVTIVLAVVALISRHNAVLAQHTAVVAQQSAERRQKQAEDLVDFMLGDLTKRLRRFDKLNVLTVVDDKAMAYFKSLPPTDVSDVELAERAKALQRIGEVRMDKSRLADAKDSFQQALRLNKRLVDDAPDDATRQNAYAENLLWIGFADWNQGRLDLAEAAFRQSAAALERAVSLAPSSNDTVQNLVDVYNNLGHVALARGELDFAEREFASDLALCRQMAAAHPDDVGWQTSLGDAHDNLATLALVRGKLGKAIEGYQQEVHAYDTATARNPHDQQIKDTLFASKAILGRTLALAGQTTRGLAYVNSALRIAKALVAFDPSHDGWWGDYAYYQALAGTLHLEQGDPAAASGPVAASIRTLQRLVRKDPDNAQWAENLAEAQWVGARLAITRRQPSKAQTLAKAALVNVQRSLKNDPNSSRSLGVEAKILLVQAQLAEDVGHGQAASQNRQQALTIATRLAAHSSDPRTHALLIAALLASNKNAAAKPYVLALQKTGYRPAGFVALLERHGIAYPPDPSFDARIARLLRVGGSKPHAAHDHP
ncbi:MAG TPA: TIR domain-containing protein [Rhodanobacteraceae bacterium]|nr:TIR domain-containing protein [Rhodanobacteraceae bacterium]